MDELRLADYVERRLPHDSELGILFRNDRRLTIFDVGACEGEDSIRYQRRFPFAELYAFEPLPSNAAKARRHFGMYGTTSIQLEETALGDTEGEADFYVSSGRPPGAAEDAWDFGNKSSSLLRPGETLDRYEWLRFDRRIAVPVTTLESYAAARRIDQIDILHLDVQGAELMVLAGAGALLGSVKAVWMEVEAVPLYRGQPLQRDVETFMKARGFVKVKDTVDTIAGDQLYIRPAFFGRWQRARLWARRTVRIRTRSLRSPVRKVRQAL